MSSASTTTAVETAGVAGRPKNSCGHVFSVLEIHEWYVKNRTLVAVGWWSPVALDEWSLCTSNFVCKPIRAAKLWSFWQSGRLIQMVIFQVLPVLGKRYHISS